MNFEAVKNFLAMAGDSIDFQIIFKSVIAALICLVIGIVILIICRKFKVFVRRNRVYNAITYIYLLYIPLVMMFFGGMFFTVKAIEHTLYNKLDEAKPAITSYSASYAKDMKDYIIKNQLMTGDISLSSIKDAIVLYLKAHPYLESVNNKYLSTAIQMLPSGAKDSLYNIIADAIIGKISETLAGATKLDKNALAKLWTMDFEELASGGFVVELIKGQMDARVKPVKTTVALIWLLFMLVPFVESFIAKMVEKGMRKKEAGANSGGLT